MKREHAWRLFAAEYNDSMVEIKSEGEMLPSYIVTPLGAKVNRLFIVGVLTDVEQVSEGNEFVRAHLSDPTGVYTLFSGQYQPEITEKLSMIEVPAFVAVTGKARAYIPDDGDRLYASVRPEHIAEVSALVRNRWILETCRLTKERIEAMREALQMTVPEKEELIKLGYNHILSEGVSYAAKHYSQIRVDNYVDMIKEALQYLTEGPKPKDFSGIIEPVIAENDVTVTHPTVNTTSNEQEEQSEKLEETVLTVIRSCEGDDGASWDMITEKCELQGVDADTVEEVLNALMDKGLIYEPVLGTIKTT
jgi:RPA family protein